MKKRLLLVLSVLALITLITIPGRIAPVQASPQADFQCPDGSANIVFIADSDSSQLKVTQAAVDRFQAKCTNIKVTLQQAVPQASDRLALYIQFLGSKSSDIDVYTIDVVWPAILAEHMVNMKDYVSQDTTDAFFPSTIKYSTVGDQLVGLPWFIDAGLLYYRTDLLQKYSFDKPPATWDELTTMAKKIQDGERTAGNADFWGYIFQAANSEASTINALEWQVSEGGGAILTRDGKIEVNTPQMVKALERAKGWIGTISPPEVLGYVQANSTAPWLAGNAAFMRNAPFAIAASNASDSKVQGKFDVGPLPAGASGTRAATAGGWILSVSKYSKNPKAAAALVQWMTSPREQAERAVALSSNPTLQGLYKDADFLKRYPIAQRLYDVFSNAVERPAVAAGKHYNDVSALYYAAVHSVLAGQKDAKTAMEDLESDLQDLLEKIGSQG